MSVTGAKSYELSSSPATTIDRQSASTTLCPPRQSIKARLRGREAARGTGRGRRWRRCARRTPLASRDRRLS
eukprot:5095778-Prymnesium_polylepis.1